MEDGFKKLAEVEKSVILVRLRIFNGHRARTAVSLGIGIRTLQNKLKEYGVPNARRKPNA
jgi:DNA-binding NtrC family response regulator